MLAPHRRSTGLQVCTPRAQHPQPPHAQPRARHLGGSFTSRDSGAVPALRSWQQICCWPCSPDSRWRKAAPGSGGRPSACLSHSLPIVLPQCPGAFVCMMHTADANCVHAPRFGPFSQHRRCSCSCCSRRSLAWCLQASRCRSCWWQTCRLLPPAWKHWLSSRRWQHLLQLAGCYRGGCWLLAVGCMRQKLGLLLARTAWEIHTCSHTRWLRRV